LIQFAVTSVSSILPDSHCSARGARSVFASLRRRLVACSTSLSQAAFRTVALQITYILRLRARDRQTERHKQQERQRRGAEANFPIMPRSEGRCRLLMREEVQAWLSLLATPSFESACKVARRPQHVSVLPLGAASRLSLQLLQGEATTPCELSTSAPSREVLPRTQERESGSGKSEARRRQKARSSTAGAVYESARVERW
jgi:hypothetical protein